MNDELPEWITDAADDSWIDLVGRLAKEGVPEPDPDKRRYYTLGFGHGGIAAIEHISDVLAKEE
jgi:hypothetical protein